MDFKDELLCEARKAIAGIPEQRTKIIELLSLAIGEIEDGGSEAHEYELFMGEIEEIKQGKEKP